MGGWTQMLRGRVGVALVGVILAGGIGAALGAGSVWHPAAPVIGENAPNSATGTQSALSGATATAQTTPTTVPTATATAAPTATRTLVGSTISGKVVSVNTGANTFIMSSNGAQYTILVDQATTYSGNATQLSDLQHDWEVSVTIVAQNGAAYLARSVFAKIDN